MANIAIIPTPDIPGGVGITGLELSQASVDAAMAELRGTGPVTGGALATIAVQVAGLVDVIAAPSRYLVRPSSGPPVPPGDLNGDAPPLPLVARWPMARVGDREGPRVGLMTEASALEDLDPNEAGLPAEEVTRRLYALALRRWLRTLPQWASPGGTTVDRPAEGWPLLIAAGARIVIALGATAIAAHYLDHMAEVVMAGPQRSRQALIAQAGADYEARLRAKREHPEQPMPEPSEAERGIRAAVESDGRSEWDALKRELGETAGTVAKVVGGLGLLWLASELFG